MRLRLFGGLTPEGWRRVTENWECSAQCLGGLPISDRGVLLVSQFEHEV